MLAEFHCDAGVERRGRSLAFPPRNVFARASAALPAGAYALTIELAQPAALYVELVLASGAVALPVLRADKRLRWRFRSQSEIEEVRLRPVEHGVLVDPRLTLNRAAVWRAVMDDVILGDLVLPPREDLMVGDAKVGSPRSHQVTSLHGLVVAEADAVHVSDRRVVVEEANGALRLNLQRSLPAGWVRIEAKITDERGWPVEVKPRVFLNDCADPLGEAGTRLFRLKGARFAGLMRLPARTEELVLRPREQAGAMMIEDLSLRRVDVVSLCASALAVRRARARLAQRGDARDRLGLWRWRPTRGGEGMARSRQAPTTKAPGRVALITATKDAPHHLGRYLTTLRDTAPGVDLVLIDNASTDPAALALIETAREDLDATVLLDDRPFNFAAMSNLGAAARKAEVLIFANNDLAFTDPDWLDALLAPLSDPRVGIVGARLLYPDGRLQHVGQCLAGELGVRHVLRRCAPCALAKAGRARKVSRTVAVTAALMAVRAPLFHALGGFDAAAFPRLYNDTDLCLRAAEAGFATVLAPEAVATHHESATLGTVHRATLETVAKRRAARYAAWRDAMTFQRRWAHLMHSDPHYPPGCDAAEARFRPAR